MARKRGQDDARKVSEDVAHWLREIAAADKREQEWRNKGKKIIEVYSGEKSESTPYNVLYANTDILLPSLYSQAPRPVVQRRFKDNDPVGLAAAKAGQRVLEFLVDTNIDGYETFHDNMKATTLDGLLPGRGTASVKYEFEEGDEVKKSELICTQYESWDRMRFGYARTWNKVPWISYERYVDEAEATRLFGEDIAKEIEYTAGDDDDDKDEKNKGDRKLACVYQIWDKDGGRKIRYVSKHYPDGYLKVDDDPLNLTGFYNIPRPVQFVEKTNDQTPTPLYELYENQAAELNNLTIRINRIISAMKARGAYDAALGDDIGKIMEADDNQLIPTEKGNSLAAERGLGNAIWFMPLEVLQQTLQQLYIAREQCKQVIYEIMGISDIVRGASKASETLGAQQLKSQWGTLRLKNKQAEVQRYARDMLRMMLEIAATKFSQETWAKMTGLPFLTDMQLQQMQMMAQGLQQQMMVEGPQGPAAMQMQQLQQQAQQIKWSDVLQMLQDDMQRAYRIDIETNSTIEPEAAEDQKNISELMNAMGQFINGVGPMVEKGVMPFQVAQSMLLAITRRFRFGNEIEDQINAMQPPKQEDDGAAQKAQQQLQQEQEARASAESKLQQKELELTNEKVGRELDGRAAELKLERTQLDYDKDVFKLEKQAAQESVVRNAQSASKELDHKKTVVGLEQKALGEKQNVAKTVDSKLAEGIRGLQQSVEVMAKNSPAALIEQMAQVNNQLVQAISAQSEQVQRLTETMSRPKRKKAIRGPDGSIVEMVEESVQ